MNTNRLGSVQLEKLSRLGSCDVANAIETFGVRLRNAGFTDSSVSCIFPDLPPMVGYAATVRVRTAEPPMEGDRYYYRLDWLEHALEIPPPRVLMLQDLDPHPGLGAFIGDVHANILQALGFVGVVTNGAVRNVAEVKSLGFQMYAGNVSVSHAFAHVFDFAKPVELGQMHAQPGDLIHGDRHGVQSIPLSIAEEIPEVAQEMIRQERELIELCHSPGFGVEKLREAVEALKSKRKMLRR